ncbi:MAG: M15 family metallopeptidase [Lachnospiraceae bacterium]|nr:M15 family metallopeptidase [Lachnospiraceae bacterium]
MSVSEDINESTEVETLNSIGSLLEPDASEMVDEVVVENIKAMPAESKVLVYETNAVTLAACFYAEEIQPSVYMRMENKSFGEECTTSLESLRYVRVLHFGFDGEIYIGELVVNQLIADDIIDIFKELFDARYPIERMVLVDNYSADDNQSMAANNSSAFNYRVVDGTSKLSNHAYGLAIDINPLYNPYVRTIDGEEVILPENGSEYADRSLDNPYYIVKGDVCYNAFIKRGFTWGGNWEKSKDYQHFQKVFE